MLANCATGRCHSVQIVTILVLKKRSLLWCVQLNSSNFKDLLTLNGRYPFYSENAQHSHKKLKVILWI